MSGLADYSTSVRQFGDRYPSSQSPGVGCVHYFEYFLERGILGAKHLRLLTRPLWLTFSLKKTVPKPQNNGEKGEAKSVVIEKSSGLSRVVDMFAGS